MWAFVLHATIHLNFDLELQKVLTTHKEAKSYSKWKLNKLYPSHHLKEVFQASKESGHQNIYCKSLLQLNKIDLYFLESFLIENQTATKQCIIKVHYTLKEFKNKQQEKLQAYSNLHFSGDLKSLSTKELYIDPEGGKILYDGELANNHFLLTFDDGPHPKITPRVLNTLKNFNVISQFFIVGKRVRHWPELVQSTHEQGHVVGNHSWSHPDMRKLSDSEAVEQIMSTFNIIKNTIDVAEPFFRFPYGAYNFPQLEYLGQQNIVSFFWNIDTYDWKIKDPVELLKFSIKKIKENNKGIILMHDLHNQTADMLPHLIQYLKSRTAQTVIFKTH